MKSPAFTLSRMELPRPPRAITFDCWSTLVVDVDPEAATRARAESLRDMARRRGVELDPDRARELIEDSWMEHLTAWRRGLLFGPEGAARWCLGRLGVDVAEEVAAELGEAIATATHSVGVRAVDGAPEALEEVRRHAIATALICDTGFTPGRVVRKVLAETGLVLDHHLFSDEFGVPKPNPRIFRAALEAIGAEPAGAVHIGDLRRTDVAGARAAGMAAVRFAGVHDDGWMKEEAMAEEADAVLRRWGDLPGLLGL